MNWPSYGRGILPELLPRSLAELDPPATALFLLVDPNAAAALEPALAEVERRLPCPCHRLPWGAGEERKTPAEAERLAREAVRRGVDRASVVVGAGGGVTTDVAGFLAAVLLRGLRWGAVPTTLLAMADAALGGKTAVNLPEGKNLIGAFHLPEFVLADVAVLAGLPEREWRCGLGEVLKSALIDGSELLPVLRRLDPVGLRRAGDDALALAAGAGRVKMRIVEADPTEQGERKLLNLGHTFGHALEIASVPPGGGRPALAHGEAVALGLRCAARLAEEMEIAAPGLRDEVVALGRRLGLPERFPGPLPPVADLAVLLRRDKKARGGRLDLVLPAEPGSCLIVRGVEAEAVAERIHAELEPEG
ncbi:MAG: 3-dehydroquinate synthase [Planctomycetota bacterium]|nr:MAG: 3-dehydroquinate synthase [Planctomycetota bacterium]